MLPSKEVDGIKSTCLAAQVAILLVIARHLKKVDKDTTQTDTVNWSIAGLADIAAITATTSNLLERRVRRSFDAIPAQLDVWSHPLFKAAGREFKPASSILSAQTAVDIGTSAAVKAVQSMCKTSVLRIIAPNGQSVPIAQAYRATLSQAVTAMLGGNTTYQYTIDKMCRQLASYGVRVAYPSGNTRELFSAVSGNVMDNYRMTTQAARNEVGVAFGSDGVEVSAHGLCAEDHLPYQGHRYTKKEFDRIQGSLARPIAQGYNCHHELFPVIMGIGKPAVSPQELKQYREQSTRPVEVDGRTMTAYQFTQRQRQQETHIRKLKCTRSILSEAGLPTADLDTSIEQATDLYNAQSKAVGIRTHPERLKAYKPA